MSIKSSTITYLLRPRVLHALPGRMRIHLPLLERMPFEGDEVVACVTRLLGVPSGIHEVVPCLVTGNVLVRFDAEQLTSDDVLRYLRAFTRLYVTNRDLLANVTVSRLLETEARLSEWLRGKLTFRLDLDGNARIPEDVLA